MKSPEKVIAIVPARSGSKGVKNKNIKLLNGQPLLSYPIIAAKKSKLVDKVILTTDSEKYAEIGRSFGAEIPFIRSDELSNDKSLRSDVIIDVIKRFPDYKTLIYLEPTSPLTTADDIDNSLKLFLGNKLGAKSLVSIAESPTHHPIYSIIKEKNNIIKPYILKSFDEMIINRQDLKKIYFFDGSLYISNCSYFVEKKEFYHNKTMGIILDEYKSIEIDNENDFNLVEFLINERFK